MKDKAKKYALLIALIANKDIKWDSKECTWYGIASDGVEVNMGFTDLETLARYLQDHPSPDTW